MRGKNISFKNAKLLNSSNLVISECGSLDETDAMNKMAMDCRFRFSQPGGDRVEYVVDSIRFCNCNGCNNPKSFKCEIPGWSVGKPKPPPQRPRPPPPPQVVPTTTTTTQSPTTSTTTTTPTAITESTTIYEEDEGGGSTGNKATGQAILTYGWFILLVLWLFILVVHRYWLRTAGQKRRKKYQINLC
jgi:hypothetical protein